MKPEGIVLCRVSEFSTPSFHFTNSLQANFSTPFMFTISCVLPDGKKWTCKPAHYQFPCHPIFPHYSTNVPLPQNPESASYRLRDISPPEQLPLCSPRPITIGSPFGRIRFDDGMPDCNTVGFFSQLGAWELARALATRAIWILDWNDF